MAARLTPSGHGDHKGNGNGIAKPASAEQASLTNTPLIPLSVIDAPTQRVYIASVFVAIQTVKVYNVATTFWTEQERSLLGMFLLLDFLFVIAVSRLRTPRLDYRKSRWIFIFSLLGVIDWQITGGWRTTLSVIASAPIVGYAADTLINVWSDTFNQQLSISEHRVRLRDLVHPSHHILGQHTIHILPYSTAAFAPSKSTSSLNSCFCLDADDAKAELSIPIIFNNTEPQFLSYSISPFDSTAEADRRVYNITISKNELIRLGGAGGEGRATEDDLDLELDDVDDDSNSAQDFKKAIRSQESQALQITSRESTQGRGSARSKGQKEVMYNLAIRKPGRIRLERVMDRNRFDARLSRSEILIVDCPKIGFERTSTVQQHHCPGEEASLNVWVKGLAPLEMSYSQSGEKIGNDASAGNVHKISHIAPGDLVTPLAAEGERSEQLALSLRGTLQQQKQTMDWAISRNISIPITLDTARQGKRTYHLQYVRDACGNTFDADARASRYLQDVNIHSRPRVVFENCSPDHPIDLLHGGQARDVSIRVEEGAAYDGPLTAEISFQGDDDESWKRNMTIDRRSSIKVDKPGSYSITGVQGKFCAGEAGSAWTCVARRVPPPTASIQFDPIQDPCAGPVGVKALAVFSGKPPFRIKYRVARKGRPSQEHEQTVQRTREEIEFRPSTEGEVTYSFTGLSDAHYNNIALDGPNFTQVLHPVAKAFFKESPVGRNRKAGGEADVILHSCQGNVAQANVNFEGVGPFELTYAIRTSDGHLLGTRTVKDVRSSSAPLQIEVPDQVASKGGMVVVTLTNVKDAKGCDRPLTAPDLSIDVRRTKPSVAFVEPRETSMLEGKQVSLPLRLAGEAPWTVRYRHVLQQGQKQKGDAEVEVQLQNIESSLLVKQPGTYELLEVRDRFCQGAVQQDRHLHVVNVRPRPQATFSEKGVTQSKTNSGFLTRAPVCVGDVASAALDVHGHYPVSVSYRHLAPDGSAASVQSFNAAQNQTSIQLSTSIEGRHTYQLLQVGDAVYAPLAISSDQRLSRLEHVVHPLPFADFEQTASNGASGAKKGVALCLGEALSGQEKDRMIPIVRLVGTPPFQLEYVIKDALGMVKKSITKDNVLTKTLALEIPHTDFPFDVTGKWSVDLVRVSDGNGCTRALTTSGPTELGEKTSSGKGSMMEIEVVESANISPVGTRSDYCVGETIDFVLQGSSPWTVEYTFEGRSVRANVKTTTFSRIAEQAGILRIDTIAHQHNRCRTVVGEKTGMKKTIHALPTVHIHGGNHFVEDLREGNQAEITFDLQGEAPFSFTYQRTQAVDRFSKPEVLETHTVTGIEEKSYTITTAEEGTWSVIWLQDKWCAVSIDMAANKATPQGSSRKMITQGKR